MLQRIMGYDEVLTVIEFGSKVYGTKTEYSDTDYIVIIDDDMLITTNEYSYENQDYHFYSESEWNNMCKSHYVECIEAHFCDDSHILKGTPPRMKIDSDLIRNEFSKTASNSFVKCKKKLTVVKDYNPRIAKKSLFHSLRILMFGIQIMKFGGIYDFKEANMYFYEIMSCEDDWNILKEKFQPVYNRLKSDFRLAHLNIKKI